MRMSRINVYLPDDLADAVKRADLNVSAVVQQALRKELARSNMQHWLETLDQLDWVEVGPAQVRQALDDARDELGV
jgi:hypothetical protein